MKRSLRLTEKSEIDDTRRKAVGKIHKYIFDVATEAFEAIDGDGKHI